MKTFLAAALLALATTPVLAASEGEPVRDIFRDLHLHGIRTPQQAIARLQAARDVPGDDAPEQLRHEYHATLAIMYAALDDEAGMQAHIAVVQQMATHGCVPCRVEVPLLRANGALRRQNADEARLFLQQAEALPAPRDPSMLYALHFTRGVVSDINGDHARAIKEAVIAGQIAARNNYPAEQVRALNLMMVANLGMGDLAHAEQLFTEAYALAERIGYTYFQIYLRGNQATIFAARGDQARQYQALEEALRLVQAQTGMVEMESLLVGNLAAYHLQRNEFAKAQARAAQALALATRVGHQRARGMALRALGLARAGLKQYPAAIDAMQQSLKVFEDSRSDGDRAETMLSLVDVYDQAGRPRDALRTLREALQTKDRVASSERDRTAVIAQEQFSAVRKDYEIKRLSLENGKRAAELSARAWQQRLWAVVAVALALGAGLLLQAIKSMRRRNMQLEARNATLHKESTHDPLTGAYNRRHCQVLLAERTRAQDDARASGGALVTGLMLLDLDFFKRINDTWGHACGDQVLVETAWRLRELVRRHDAVVRWGGEEFLLVLPDTPPEGMAVLAERVLRAIGAEPYVLGGQPIQVTASLGCVAWPSQAGQRSEDALHIADQALYLSKSTGRNRATCVVAVSAGASSAQLAHDLRASEAAGEVRLHTLVGPGGNTETMIEPATQANAHASAA